MGLQGNWYLQQCYKIRGFQDLISEHQKVRHFNLQKILLILFIKSLVVLCAAAASPAN